MDEINTISRPKVHRLPQYAQQKGRLYFSRIFTFVLVSACVVASIPAFISWREDAAKQERIGAASSSEGALVPVADLAPAAGGEADTIAVRDDRSALVGQLTKMPADVERNIGTTARADEQSGKELMNIISKY